MSVSRSRFINYLEQPHVLQQLQKNQAYYLSSLHMDSGQIGQLSRCFNSLPDTFEDFQTLVAVLSETIKVDENDLSFQLETWLDLAICYGLDDLFDENSDIREELVILLDKATMASLFERYGTNQIKIHLLSAYLCLLGEIASANAIQSLVMDSTIKDANERAGIFCQILNRRINELDNVDINTTFFDTYLDRLKCAALCANYSPALKKILRYASNTNPYMITETLATFWSNGKRSIEKAVEKIAELLDDNAVRPDRLER